MMAKLNIYRIPRWTIGNDSVCRNITQLNQWRGFLPLAPHRDSLQYIHHVRLMQRGQNRGVTIYACFVRCSWEKIVIAIALEKLKRDLLQPYGIRYDSISLSVRFAYCLTYWERVISGVILSVVVPPSHRKFLSVTLLILPSFSLSLNLAHPMILDGE